MLSFVTKGKKEEESKLSGKENTNVLMHNSNVGAKSSYSLKNPNADDWDTNITCANYSGLAASPSGTALTQDDPASRQKEYIAMLQERNR